MCVCFRSLVTGGALVACLTLLPGAPEDPRPSAYAPAGDLMEQVKYFTGQVANDLSNEEDYGEDQQKRIEKNASTLAVLALVLGKHDEANDVKPVASAVIAAASKLAAEADQFAAAQAAFAELQSAMKSSGDGSVEWQPVADIVVLMQQVPIVNNSLRRGVGDDRRFRRSKDRNAGYAATLAAIAQASRHDTTYCGGDDDEKLWAEICGELRDSSAAVGTAIRKGDQATAKEALARVVKTCDACHESFR